MQARFLPARHGLFWLWEGWRIYRRQAPLLTALTMAYLFAILLMATLTQALALVLVPLLLPILSLMLGNGVRVIQRSIRFESEMLLVGVTGQWRALLRLGLWQIVGATLISLLEFILLRIGLLNELQDKWVMADIWPHLLFTLLAGIPYFMATTFAPYLVAWRQIAPLQALFFSFVACWRNLRAFLLWLAFALLLAAALPVLPVLLVQAVAPDAAAALRTLMQLIILLLLVPTLSASVIAAYQDIFSSDA